MSDAGSTDRARGYAVLSRLLLDGAHGVDPSLAKVFVEGPVDDAELRSQYVAAFDLGVPPYASALLESTGRVGGAVTRVISDAMAEQGPPPQSEQLAADHLGVLFAHLARQCRAGRETEAARFAASYVLSWLPAYLTALERLSVPFWIAVTRVALDVVSDHVRLLAGAGDAAELGSAELGSAELGSAAGEAILANRGTGLRDVAEYLASAGRSGLFMSDAECSLVARPLDLPRGFGSRRQRLETLLRSAAEYDVLPALCQSLGTMVAGREERLRELAEGRFDPSHLEGWMRKLAATQQTLEELGSAAAGATPREDRSSSVAFGSRVAAHDERTTEEGWASSKARETQAIGGESCC